MILETLKVAVSRFKKPHKHFLPGDVFVGVVMDGTATNVKGWGWSSKCRLVVGGKWGYRVRYCGWERAKGRHHKAARNACIEHYHLPWLPTGRGHLRVIKWLETDRFFEQSPQLHGEKWLRRLLLELSCGNLPLSREEAAPSKRLYFLP